MRRLRVFAFWISLAGTLIFVRAEYLVGVAAGYGIKQADRNLLLFRIAAAAFALVLPASVAGFIVEMFKSADCHRKVNAL